MVHGHSRKAVHWVGALGFCIGLSGCHAQEVRSLYAIDHGCPEDQVSVSEIPTPAGQYLTNRMYRVRGCHETAIYQCVDGTCFPIHESSPPVARHESEPEPSPRGAEERLAASNGEARLGLDLKLGNKSLLKLRAEPEQHGELLQMKLLRSEEKPRIQNCQLDLMVNNQRFAMPKPRSSRKVTLSSLMVAVPPDVIAELAMARQVGVRACQFRWSLNDEQIADIRRFVARYEEELAWRREPTKQATGGLLAPMGGWPEWNVASRAPAPAADGPALGTEALFESLAPSVFQVEALLDGGVSQGSAVAVTTTELLTNCHVLQGARKIILKQQDKEWLGKLQRAHAKTDRCVLSVQDPVLTPIKNVRAYSDLKVGEPLFTLGSPNGLELTISDGILSGLREIEGRRLVQTTAPISPGSSGGGLFDSRGSLVGITVSMLVGKHRINQALNFAVPAESFWAP